MDLKNSFDAKLIQEMRNHPLMYDGKSPDYKHMQKKFKVWCEIAKKLGKSVDTCKQRWKTLRYRFLTETVKLRARGGNPASVKWPFFKKLSFLEGHINPRKSLPLYGDRKESQEKDDYEDHYRMEAFAPIDCTSYMSAEPQVNIIEANYADYDYRMNNLPQIMAQKRQCENVAYNQMEVPGKKPKLHTPVIDEEDVKEVPLDAGYRLEARRRSSRRVVDRKLWSFLESMGKIMVNNCGDSLNHEPFLQLLAGKLNRLPALEQEDVKMEVLNRVHQRVSEYERNQPPNDGGKLI